jgi:hypothetical protein
MIRKHCPHNPVWPRFQRQHFKRRKTAKRLVRWILAIAETKVFVDPLFAEDLFYQASRLQEAVSK